MKSKTMVLNFENLTNELLTKTEINYLFTRHYLQNLTNHAYLNPLIHNVPK